jgi:hypothetical protein
VKAHTPQELPLVFEHHLNAQDVAGLMADYYADDATYALSRGRSSPVRTSRPRSRGSSRSGSGSR